MTGGGRRGFGHLRPGRREAVDRGRPDVATEERSQMPRRLALLLVVVFLAGNGSCQGPPESVLPLSEPEAAYDARLPGFWHLAEAHLPDHEADVLHIRPWKDSPSLDVLGVGVGYRGEARAPRWIRATAHATRIYGETYYNVRRVPNLGDDYTLDTQPGYIIVRAEVAADDTLTLRFMDLGHGGFVEELCRKRQLSCRQVYAGEAGKAVYYLLLDVSRTALAALVRDVTPEKLFPVEVGPFRRVPTVTPVEIEKLLGTEK